MIGFFAVELGEFYHFPFLEVVEHGVDSGFILGAEVGDEVAVGFNAVGGSSKVGDEVQDIDLFHDSKNLLEVNGRKPGRFQGNLNRMKARNDMA